MVFLSWLVSGAWTCHRSVVQIRHLYPQTELIEIYNLRPIPRPWHRDKAQLSSKTWRYEGPLPSVILLKNRLFTDLNIWIYAEFYAIFTVPSRNAHLQANDELYRIYFLLKIGQKTVEKYLTHFVMARILRRSRFRAQILGLLWRKVGKKQLFLTRFVL